MQKIILGLGGAVMALTGAVILSGCQCAPPVRECDTRDVDISKESCPPVRECNLTTVIRRTDQVACPALPPVGEICVVNNRCARTKMVFVNVRPDDRLYRVQNLGFERPWPWGPYGMGECQY